MFEWERYCTLGLQGLNTIAITLLFNYVDRSWAMGVENFLFSASNLNRYGTFADMQKEVGTTNFPIPF
jgi:hypothetical protein